MQRWHQGVASFTGVNSDGRPNDIFYFGYNAAAAGGRVSTGDAGWQNRYESHYTISSPFFEFHTPEVTTTAGTLIRLNSTYVDKATAAAFQQNIIGSVSWANYGMAADAPYANISCYPGSNSDGTGGVGVMTLYKRGTTNELPRYEIYNGSRNAIQFTNDGFAPELVLTPGGDAAAYNFFNFHGMSRVAILSRTGIVNNLILAGRNGANGGGILIQDAQILDATTLNAALKLDVQSTAKASRPFPSMTKAQREAISTPPTASHVYQSDNAEGVYQYNSAGAWTMTATWGYVAKTATYTAAA
jgi:hypothetical protein